MKTNDKKPPQVAAMEKARAEHIDDYPEWWYEDDDEEVNFDKLDTAFSSWEEVNAMFFNKNL